MGESQGSSQKKDYLKKPMVVNFGPGPDESIKPGQNPYDMVAGGGGSSMASNDFMVNDRSGAS